MVVEFIGVPRGTWQDFVQGNECNEGKQNNQKKKHS
jgi:hypothetical protein